MQIAINSHVNEIQHGPQYRTGPEILEFAFDGEDILADPDVLRQSRPKGKLFKLQAPSDFNAVPPSNVAILANSMGTAMIAVRFPHFTFLKEEHAMGDAL